jgi:hypothetical protein
MVALHFHAKYVINKIVTNEDITLKKELTGHWKMFYRIKSITYDNNKHGMAQGS